MHKSTVIQYILYLLLKSVTIDKCVIRSLLIRHFMLMSMADVPEYFNIIPCLISCIGGGRSGVGKGARAPPPLPTINWGTE